MFKQSRIIAKAIETLVADVRNFVTLNGGFISTHSMELDTMYAYVVDWDTMMLVSKEYLQFVLRIKSCRLL